MSENTLTARTAVDEYLEQLTGVCQATKNNHRSRLNHFVEWCEEEGITSMSKIDERKLIQFRSWRKDDVAAITLRMQFGTVRKFIRFCEQINVVTDGVSANVDLPSVPKGEDVNDDLLTGDEAEALAEYFEKFEYASRRHVIYLLFWRTGCRLSTLHSFDVRDFSYEQQHIKARHRPDTGTSLKNRQWGERTIGLVESSCEVLKDYLENNHPLVEDEHGRLPLVGTANGRAHRTTITKEVYKLTRPCHYNAGCPENKNPSECQYAQNTHASKCPVSVSPHAVRRGALTDHLHDGWPHKALSDRADVSVEVLDKHYDKATEEEKADRRRRYLMD